MKPYAEPLGDLDPAAGDDSDADLKRLAEDALADAAAFLRFRDGLQTLYETIEAAGRVVVASAHGCALAGGPELALACDIVVTADDAELGDQHIRRNLLPGSGGSQRLPHRLGPARGR